MAQKKPSKPRPYPDSWTVEERWQVETGRWLEPGTEAKIVGEPGRFRFIKAVTVTREDGTTSIWLDFMEDQKDGRKAFRSFSPERVKRVHRIKKLRGNGEDDNG